MLQFPHTQNTAGAKYSEFMMEGKEEGHRQEFSSETSDGRLLGDDTFIAEVLKKTEHKDKKTITIDEIIKSVGKICGLAEKEIASGGKQRYPSETRGMITYLVREARGLLLADLSKRIKRDTSSLNEAAEKVSNCSIENGEPGKRKKILEEELLQIPQSYGRPRTYQNLNKSCHGRAKTSRYRLR